MMVSKFTVPAAELRKIEGFWTLIFTRRDGTTANYRYSSCGEARRAAKRLGIEEVVKRK